MIDSRCQIMLLEHTEYYYYRLFPAKFILFHFQSQPEEHDGPSFIRFTARRGTIDSLAPTPPHSSALRYGSPPQSQINSTCSWHMLTHHVNALSLPHFV